MRYVLAALLLPALLPPALAQDNEAEKLFRQIEKKIRTANALQLASDLSISDKGKEVKFKTSLLVTKDNKMLLRLSGEQNGVDFRMEITADGKRLRVPSSPAQPLPKNFHDAICAMASRVGVLGSFVIVRGSGREAKEMEPVVEKLAPLSDFKQGAAEKVAGRDTRVVSYDARLQGKEPARITLWVDAKTLLPLKRLIVPKGGGERITETYSVFLLNPKKLDFDPPPPEGWSTARGKVTYRGQVLAHTNLGFDPLRSGEFGGRSRFGVKSRVTQTDAEGNYTIKNLAQGEYAVTVYSAKVPVRYRDPGFTNLTITIKRGANDNADLEVPGTTASGKLIYKGKPLPNTSLDFHPFVKGGRSRGTRTDAEGNFTQQDLTAGDYRVVVISESVPARYRQRETTPLKVTIKKGANDNLRIAFQ